MLSKIWLLACSLQPSAESEVAADVPVQSVYCALQDLMVLKREYFGVKMQYT